MGDNKILETEEKQLSEGQNEQLAMMETMTETPKAEVEFGALVKGKVVSINDESIFIDVSLRNEAIMAKSEALDAEGKVTLAEGDEVELYVISATEDEVIVSKSLKNGKANKQFLREMQEKELPVEGRITGMNKGGYNVTILGKKAFCPFSAIDTSFPTDPATLMGTNMDFVIARIESRGNNIVLTRIPLLQGNIEERIVELEAAAEEETPVAGTVTRITTFGAFVELGGIEGLVHVSELTWDRDEEASSVVSEGQAISVKILSVERKDTLRDSRISLSLKRLANDPWIDALATLNVGDSVEGEITRLVGFGAFVKLFPGVEGLIRTEEMGWGRVRKPSDVVKKGEKVQVTITKLDHDNHKIDCSLKDIALDPWSNLEGKYAVGGTVPGTVAGEKDYGYFVDLDENITGLLLKRRIAKDKIGTVKIGETIEVTIDTVDTDERRIGLSCGDVGEIQEQSQRGGGRGRSNDRAAVADYMKKQKAAAANQESDFAFMLKAALGKKN